MRNVWLACCGCEDYPAIQREVEARDGDAQVFRTEDAHMALSVAGSLARSRESVLALVALRDRDASEELVAALMALEGPLQVVAIVHEPDPGYIARLFSAGASEVIVADGARPRQGRAQRVRMKGNSAEPDTSSDDDDADQDPEVSRATSGLAQPSSAEADHEAAPRGPSGGGDMDLDEPDSVSFSPAGRKPSPHAGRRAPVIAITRGRGGSGATTLAATLAIESARAGLRTALLDLDLMFGNLAAMVGAPDPANLEHLIEPAARGALDEESIVRSSVRVAPCLTIWGPVERPERAELVGGAVDLLLEVLRDEADVVIADTSAHWSDAVAAAVSACDRCLVVASPDAASVDAAVRLSNLIARMGVPRTRITPVLNRCGKRDEGETFAARLEFGLSCGEVARISDGGREVGEMASIGRLGEALDSSGAFRADVGDFCAGLLAELGCVSGRDLLAGEGSADSRKHRSVLSRLMRGRDAL